MAGAGVAIALLSACLHAAWNVRLKASADPLRLAARGLALGTIAGSPLVAAAWFLTGQPGLPWQGWGLAAASAALEVAYFHLLARAYQRGDISSVYPTARGTAPLLAITVGVGVLGERLTPFQAAGSAALLAGIWLVRPPRGTRLVLPLALVIAVAIAGYSAVDRVGVRTGPFWLYSFAVFALTSLGLAPWSGGLKWRTVKYHLTRSRQGRRAKRASTTSFGGGPPPPDRHDKASGVPQFGLLAVASYSLVLLALSLAPLALVAPVRESGVIIVALWAVIGLGERDRIPARLGGSACVLMGLVLIVV